MYLIIQVTCNSMIHIYNIYISMPGVLGIITVQQPTADVDLNHSKAAHQGKKKSHQALGDFLLIVWK